MLNLGSMISGAFALPARSPGAVAAWAAIYTLPGVATWFVMRPVMTRSLQDRAELNSLQYFSSMLLVQLGFFMVVSLLIAAALRAALRPGEPSLAGLRLGADELRIVGLALLLAFGLFMGVVFAALVFSLVVATMGVAASTTEMTPIFVIFFLPILLFVIWLLVRLSLVFALTFVRRRITIGESWELTRGRFWVLFGGYFVILLFLFVLSILASLLMAAGGQDTLMQTGLDPEAMQTAAREQASKIGVMTVVGWVFGGVWGGLGIALFAGATATVVRGLGIDEEEIARTFA